MGLKKIGLLLLCLVFVAAAQTQTGPRGKTFRVNLDAIEQQLKDHPGQGDEHRKHPEKYKPYADLSASNGDHVIWFSKTAFHMTKSQRIPENIDENPFQKDITDMKSVKVGNRYEVDSGVTRTDLTFPEKTKGGRTGRLYYKVNFIHEAPGSKEIDPHLGVHH